MTAWPRPRPINQRLTGNATARLLDAHGEAPRAVAAVIVFATSVWISTALTALLRLVLR
jgi:hypothetical protein